MADEQPDFDEKLRHSTPPVGERETAPEPEWAESQSAIAEILGVDRNTIQRWLKKRGNPGHDGEHRYHIAKWRDFAVLVGRKTRTPDKASAELEGILLKNKMATLEYEKEVGNLLTYQEVAELLGGMGNAFALRLSGSRYALGPLVAGQTVPEATKRIGVEHHRALGELAVPDWAKKKVGPAGAFWSKVSRHLSGLQRTASPGDGPSSTS